MSSLHHGDAITRSGIRDALIYVNEVCSVNRGGIHTSEPVVVSVADSSSLSSSN